MVTKNSRRSSKPKTKTNKIMIDFEADNLPESEDLFDRELKEEIQSKIKINGRSDQSDTSFYKRKGKKWHTVTDGTACYDKVEDTFKSYGFPRGSETFETSQSKRSNEDIKNDSIYPITIPRSVNGFK